MIDERVSDQLDRASQLEEMERANCAQLRKPTLGRIGKCHSCKEVIEPNGLFCDEECSETWEKEQKLARIRGSRR